MGYLKTKRIRYILLAIALLPVTITMHAQSIVGTVFNQHGTEMDYYLQQIAAFEVYAKDLKSGYKAVSGGLHTISDIKNGEFNLHQAYFSSLTTVSPSVKNDPKVNGILLYQSEITQCFSNMFASLSGSKQMSASETTYLRSVYNNLLSSCNEDLGELSLVITNGKVQMKDDERMRRIDALYNDMQDKYQFAQDFTRRAITLTVQRAHEQNNVQVVQQLYQNK